VEINNYENPLVLYVHKRNTLVKTFTEPPKEIILDTGNIQQKTFTCKDLIKQISYLYDTPADCLLTVKYVFHNNALPSWYILEDKHPDKQQQQQQKKGKKQKHGKNIQNQAPQADVVNIRKKPFYLKDGDIIAVKDIREDLENEDDFITMDNLKANQFTQTIAKDTNNTGSKKKERPQEKNLAIKVSFN